jgi:hypothetical protein
MKQFQLTEVEPSSKQELDDEIGFFVEESVVFLPTEEEKSLLQERE